MKTFIRPVDGYHLLEYALDQAGIEFTIRNQAAADGGLAVNLIYDFKTASDCAKAKKLNSTAKAAAHQKV